MSQGNVSFSTIIDVTCYVRIDQRGRKKHTLQLSKCMQLLDLLGFTVRLLGIQMIRYNIFGTDFISITTINRDNENPDYFPINFCQTCNSTVTRVHGSF